MEPFSEIMQQNEQWVWIIVILISVFWSVLNYRKRKKIRREAQEYQKDYYDCFDDDGNYIEGKMEEYMKKQKERYNKKYKKYNNYTDDRPEKTGIGDFF